MIKKNIYTSTLNCNKIAIGLSIVMASSNVMAGAPTVWVKQITGGEVLFYDWGYRGPQGQNAGEWESNGVFDGASQIQHVITTDADRLTPDVSYQHIQTEFDVIPLFRNPNMDTQVNFYKWGYTTVGGSTFDNMQIDVDGDYLIRRNDMTFKYYGTIDYQYDGVADISTLNNNAEEGISDSLIDFQPYALSDAKGWCGSITASNPGALEAMAGQVTFDFGFEVFLLQTPKDSNGVGIPGAGSLQIVKDFEMRSYGSIEVNVSIANGGPADLVFKADAVVNNTSPLASTIPITVPIDSATGEPEKILVPILNMDASPALDANSQPRMMEVNQNVVGAGGVDENYYNKVSFMGAGSLAPGAWVEVIDNTVNKVTQDNLVRVIKEGTLAEGSPEPLNSNVIYHQNSFAGYPFLLRADGNRVLDGMDFSLYSNFSGVPVNSIDANGNMINLEGNIVADLTDTDNDGVLDSVDNCLYVANPNQNDSGGVDSNLPDGIGDACQCGDVNGNGIVTNTDAARLRLNLMGMPLPFNPELCDVSGDGKCTNTDAVLIQRTVLGLPPGLRQSCTAATN